MIGKPSDLERDGHEEDRGGGKRGETTEAKRGKNRGQWKRAQN